MPAYDENQRKPRPPTTRQLVVLSMLDQWIKIHDGLSPTYRQLGEWCKCKSTRTIAEHVYYLIKKGMVSRIPNEARSLAITDAGAKCLKLTKVPTIQIRIG